MTQLSDLRRRFLSHARYLHSFILSARNFASGFASGFTSGALALGISALAVVALSALVITAGAPFGSVNAAPPVRPNSAAIATLVRASSSPAPAQQVFYTPIELVSASDTRYPPDSRAEGVVVLDVSLTERGQAAEVGAMRDIASLTTIAATSVQSWKFKPALHDGMPVPSAMTVAFVFRPPVLIWKPPVFAPAIPNPGSSTNAMTPAAIDSVVYAEYPVDTVASGSVVVQISVDDMGKVQRVDAVRALPPFTQPALDAAKQWKFEPARYLGERVPSKVAVVFVFAQPATNE